ncbi:SRPBCC family protein [Amycolatopsis sp. YIM 10]|uniref:SRPBCC family protein n=1 Tax=Amycolatopsis sp. YIM 10 TaxID=2653857 RepID=UPI0012A7F156|nr:SRPBCC family protein [Amycolatopsis sp. YIM 10]QFU88321.1 Polyketide cyclase / dehydrase and lipid transport [Amycolatopsis sp. YIM 10]
MKYTNSIEIALPRERVAQLLADPAHLPKWLRGLVLHEPLSGLHGQPGTQSRVVLQSGKRKFECTETITRRDPADPIRKRRFGRARANTGSAAC